MIDYIKLCDIGLTNTVAQTLDYRGEAYLLRACVMHDQTPGAVRFHWRQPVIFVNPIFVKTPEGVIGVIEIIERLSMRIDVGDETCHEFRWNGVQGPKREKVFEI